MIDICQTFMKITSEFYYVEEKKHLKTFGVLLFKLYATKFGQMFFVVVGLHLQLDRILVEIFVLRCTKNVFD